MSSDEYNVIQRFLNEANSADHTVEKALGVSGRNFQLFWAALNACGEGLEIADLNKLTRKALETENPSAYIHNLSKTGFIKRGETPGSWKIAPEVVKRLETVLNGGALKELPRKSSRSPAKRVKKSSGERRPGTLSPKVAKKTIGDVVRRFYDRRSQIDRQIVELQAERDGIDAKIAEIVRLFDE